MKAKDVYGRIVLFGEFILPLEEAQKIQMIMAKYAKGVETVYRGGGEESVQYIQDIEMPKVLAANQIPKFSTEGLSVKHVNEWRDAVGASEGEDFLSPQDFSKLRGSDYETNS